MQSKVHILSFRSIACQMRSLHLKNLSIYQNYSRQLHVLASRSRSTSSTSNSISISNSRRILPFINQEIRNSQNILLTRYKSTSVSAGTQTIQTQTEDLTTSSGIVQSTTSNSSTGPPGVDEAASAAASNTTTNAAIENTVVNNLPPKEVFESVASVGNVEIIEKQPIEFIDIPDVPLPPLDELIQPALNALGEPTLQSLGLGSMYPSGLAQQFLEFLHVNLNLPWCGAIVAGTIVIRMAMFPLVLKSQRNSAKMQNVMPQMQVIQMKMTEARQSGNALMAAKYSQELMIFMKEKDISPFKNMIVPMAMMPFFLSFFFGLRGMANLPLESMTTGGIFWFTDLTVVDPYYLLPIMTSVTLAITIEIGADGMKLNANQSGQIAKYLLRSLPVIMFPFIMNFPAAMLCYWCSTNMVSLIQVSILKIPRVRDALKIERVKPLDPASLPMKSNKGFVENIKDSYRNVKITKELENRENYDEMAFKRAGRGPIPKTFKYDPTKVQAKST